MKVELENIRLDISELTGQCQVGIKENKNPLLWKEKKEIHSDFIRAVINCFKSKKQVISYDGYEYTISVKSKKIKYK